MLANASEREVELEVADPVEDMRGWDKGLPRGQANPWASPFSPSPQAWEIRREVIAVV